MDFFPVSLFPPSAFHWDVAGTPQTGGTPVSGPPQTADASCGGWWVCDFDVARLEGVEQFKTWRAMMGRLRVAAGRIVVPVIDICQPWPDGVFTLPDTGRFAAISTYSEAGLFAADAINATLAADAFAPAWPTPAAAPTVTQIEMNAGAPLTGGEYFSATGDDGLPHLHWIAEVTAIVGNVYTVTITPPFRQDFATGKRLEFDTPCCAVKLDPASIGNVLPRVGSGFVASPSVRFIETGI